MVPGGKLFQEGINLRMMEQFRTNEGEKDCKSDSYLRQTGKFFVGSGLLFFVGSVRGSGQVVSRGGGGGGGFPPPPKKRIPC
jgi:hypothetical protein